jgi:UDP-N-acetylglucosamine/UDP-N-acetylgalactosamine diphosphorylase
MKQQLLNTLKPFGQEHLLTFWDDLTAAEQKTLAGQIESIDFGRIAGLYSRRNEPAESLSVAGCANDPPGYKFSTVTDPSPVRMPKPITAAEAVQAGENALQNGKAACCLVAGGQGTRLGFPHPKGMFPIGPLSKATLFQFHFEKVKALSQRYHYSVPYCIMTSPATHRETVDFLRNPPDGAKPYFGLAEEDVFIFCQGTMPAVSLENGKVLLESKGSIALSPDGHGGMLAAMAKGTAESPSVLATLRQRGIEYLFYNQVDNPLVRIGSPEFLGYHLLSGSELTSQVIRKKNPAERVGNIIEASGKLYVIEYSDLPESVAKQTLADGSLKIWAGSIAVHVFSIHLLERSAKNADLLPFHIAKKKVPFIETATGHLIKPDKENAIKFERFMFDLLPLAVNAAVVEVDAANHYAPLKNAPGNADSPETVRRDISAMHRSWLNRAGAVTAADAVAEISPLFADSPEMLAGKIQKGETFGTAVLLR